MNGTDLLGDFRETRSEAAFREIVRRYTNLVYSVAKRRLWDTSLAEEVTQTVFIRLAEAAPKIRTDAELMAWLHRTTVHVAIDLWRSETRRRAREEHAAAMQTPDYVEETAWNDLAPLLDEALNELADADRQALMLRFFDEKPMRELGRELGVSEDAAKMRVSRAMDRLRNLLTVRGITCSAVALTTLVAEHSVEAAPAQLVNNLALLKIPAAGIGASAGAAGFLANFSKAQFVAGVAALILVGTVSVVLFSATSNRNSVSDGASNKTSATVSTNEIKSAQNADASAAQHDQEAEPRKLLEKVFAARKRVASGKLELKISTHFFAENNRETLRHEDRFEVVFSGGNCRFESVRREYGYVAMGDKAVEAARPKVEEFGLDKEAAVRAGLLRGYETHRVTAYDGAAILNYEEHDGKQGRATIDEPGKSAAFCFDPRCLGLSITFSQGKTLEKLFDYYLGAKEIRLIGEEFINGVPARHVFVKTEFQSLDFWIDSPHPNRLLKLACGKDVVISNFDETNPDDPIPTEVQATAYRNGSLFHNDRIVRLQSKFNLPVDPASWTLSGLNIAVGADVGDNRIMRRIGYWTGSGLSDNLPATNKKNAKEEISPDRAKLLAWLDNDPMSPEARDAAMWIMRNTPDGSDVEKAADVFLREHLQTTNLISFCHEMERMRHRSSKRVLEGILEGNPDTDIRGNACFALANLVKAQCDYGKNKEATDEAITLFERVIAEFGTVKNGNPSYRGYSLAQVAKPELYELQHLIIGKPAPETAGVDLDGAKLSLNDFRGKVVVLVFWGRHGCHPDMDELRKFTETHEGRPVALVGVYSDNHPEEAKAEAEKNGITFPSFCEDRNGAIWTAWNNDSWPAVQIIDAQGIIRGRHVWGISKAVDALLNQ